MNEQARVHCPVCQAHFRFIEGWQEGDIAICPVCGERLLLKRTADGWAGDRVDAHSEKEIRDRAENYAKLKGYRFGELKEELIEGLVGKQKRFGDFYCPCRMHHTPEYQCPCKPTRGGDVERDGRCYCGFFWK
jgi:ferredoxin-thioredoxin reductase catalytic subunit/DNA-directed RNA polymerase subunit RPC12/RpoP